MKSPALLLLAACAIARAAEPCLIPPDDRKQLVFDSRVIVSTENARLAPGTVTKDPRNPLMPADQPWENATNNLYPNVLWDADAGASKLWYKCVLFDKDVIAKMDDSSTVPDVGWYFLYAASRDGLAWAKPKLDLHHSQCIYAPSGPPIAQDGDLLIYYGGSDFPHTGWKRHCLLSLARLPLDHWAGYEPVEKSAPAVLTSAPLRLAEPPRVTAEVRGTLRIRALAADGKVLAEAEPITGDVTDALVRWRGELKGGSSARFRIELRDAKLYALGGVELLDEKVPEPVNPLRDLPPQPIRSAHIGFDTGPEGWKGLDTIEHHANGGARGGYISAIRGKGLTPFVHLPAAAADSPLAGDWSQRFGGRGAKITASLRSPKPGVRVKFEVFADDIAAWTCTAATVRDGWTHASATLRYGWTDTEARAAGWQPGPTAFSWAEDHRARRQSRRHPRRPPATPTAWTWMKLPSQAKTECSRAVHRVNSSAR